MCIWTGHKSITGQHKDTLDKRPISGFLNLGRGRTDCTTYQLWHRYCEPQSLCWISPQCNIMRCLRPGGVHSENPTIRSLALASWWPFQLINKAGMWEDGCVKCGPWLTADCLCGAGEQPKENFATADVPGKRCEFLVFLEPFHAKKKNK